MKRQKINKGGAASTRDKAKREPRRPSRGPGVVRFNALVDATERLLTEHSPDDIGLYQIGEAAGAPMASVYHFFPTTDAAFLALTERYLEGFLALTQQPVEASKLRSWQDLVDHDLRQAMEFYNTHPPAMKIFLGGFGGLEARQANIRYNRGIAMSLYARLNAAFHMPLIRDVATKFQIAVTLLDAVWAVSYEAHGRITDEFCREAKAVLVSYCGLILPPQLEPRDECLEAAAKGAQIQLPPLAITS